MSNDRTGFSPTKTHRPKQSLTLAHAQRNPIGVTQMMREQFAVPQVLGMAQRPRLSPQIRLDLLPGGLVQPARSARSLALLQAAESSGFEPQNPAFDGRGMLSQQLGHFITTHALGGEQDSVKPVVVARLLGAGDLILQGQDHRGGIGNL
jgi:hypothetical protein